jgi:steroid delta-isomerase-like uncharacterized protein
VSDLEHMKAAARIEFEQIYSLGRLDLIDQIVGDDYVCYDPALPQPVYGAEGLRQAVVGFRTALPDLTFTVDQQIAEGDRVVTAWTARGTQLGELFGIAPTGRAVTMIGVDIERFVDGKIVEVWANWDAHGVIQQLTGPPEA